MKRQRGLGFVYQRNVIWWCQYNVRGVMHRQSSKSQNRADAVRLLKQRIAEIATNKPVGSQIEKTTLDDLAVILIDNLKANGPKSISRTEIGLRHLRDYFGGETRAIAIDSARVTAYVAHRLERAAPGTVNFELTTLSHAFTLALRAGRVGAKPSITKLHLDNARRGFFEPDAYTAVLAQLPDYLKPVIECAFYTGWRTKSELLTRTWKSVDFENAWLRLDIGESKSGEARSFPLSGDLLAVLREQRERVSAIERATGQIIKWVFVHPNGERIQEYRYAWIRACRDAGYPGKLVHDLRRTAVRNLERAAVPRSSAMAMIGHKTEAMYRRYSITDEVMLREASQKLELYHTNSPIRRENVEKAR